MKKAVLLFITFIIAFAFAFIFLYFKANESDKLTDQYEPLEWHGRVETAYGVYNGAIIGDLFSGKGSFNFLSGETYVGDWKDSYMSGDGVVTFNNIGDYSGEMRESKRNGKGTFVWKSGEKYEGMWENDEMSGEGTYTFADGSVLEGVFSNNKPVSGTLNSKIETDDKTLDSDIIMFVYTFSANQKSVMFKTKGGLIYDGELLGLMGEGKATITYPSGNAYEGQISNGKREGFGKYSWNDENGKMVSYYEGNWESDHMNGQGKYYYSNANYPYLEGTFENDLPVGTLKYYKASGSSFDAVWQNGSCISVK